MHKLFLDANVLFTAAHNPGGKAAFLFHPAGGKHWSLTSSAYAVEEARRNVAVKYPQSVQRLEELIARLALSPQPASSEAPIALPEKDRPIFQSARAAGAPHLITGDLKHFGPHMNRPAQTEGIVIQTVADFLASL